ncbi:MAG: MFS transporter [Chloroflexi bacterium]|nr:MFS transporter [Chloroflexota bacterium]MDA1282985.1 MFS transporter [Chloroflexota bacterium]
MTQNQPTVSLWSNLNFRKLLLSGLLLEVMRQFETLAIAVFVFQKTGNAFYVAMMLFIQRVPLIPFGLVFGVVADRFDRKNIFVAIFAVLAVEAAILGFLASQDNLEIWQVAIGVFINGVIWTTDFSVRRPMLAESVGNSRAGRAVGLDGALMISALAVGPVIGGGILQFMGMKGVYFFGTGAYVIGGLIALTVKYQRPIKSVVRPSFTSDFRLALGFARSRSVIVGIIAITVIVDMWATPIRSIIPVIGEDDLGLSPLLVGVLVSSQGVGSLIGAALIAFRGDPAKYGRIYFYGSFLYLIPALLFSLSNWFVLSLPLVFIGGLGLAAFSTTQGALILMATPPEMRSRMLGLLAVGIGIGPIGILNIGLMATLFGPSRAVMIVSIEGIVALAFAAVVWPMLRRGEDISPS